MRIPFTGTEFLEVFARLNAAIWPAQLGAYALGVAVVALAVRGGGRPSRAVPWLLAGAWAFVAVAYHLVFFSEVNPAARAFAAAFVVQAALFARAGLRRGIAFGLARSPRAAAGLALVAYAMVAYPIVGAALGHAYPASPVFGVTPCPTTIFTFGVLLLARGPVPVSLLVVPTLWAVVGASAALQLGMREDLGLPVAAVAAVAFLVRGHAPEPTPPERTARVR